MFGRLVARRYTQRALQQHRFQSTIPRWSKLSVTEELEEALQSKRPIVALETAILTHGMSFPRNYELALHLENLIREGGAIPATVGIIDGVPKIGLTKLELEQLSDPQVPAVKVSRRDIAPSIAQKMNGGTTVSGTMYLAHQAGIKLFVTGGIGGVHRGGENSMDISADLTELGRTPVAVVCAGAKSILDIGRSLEFLETQGVTVATLGPEYDFPAFYSPRSGFFSPWKFSDEKEAASTILTGLQMPRPVATLVGVPIPVEWEEKGKLIQEAVEQAVAEAEEAEVVGKEVTPWLLSRVSQLTDGQAVESNIALIENNARKGATIAVEMAKLEGGEVGSEKIYTSAEIKKETNPQVVVVGSAAVDITSSSSLPGAANSKTTFPGEVRSSPGGVSLNVALCASRLLPPASVALVSPIGQDAFGDLLGGEISRMGMRTDGLLPSTSGDSTAVCSLFLDPDGGLEGGVADMDIVEKMDVSLVTKYLSETKPKMVAFDANLTPETIQALLEHCNANDIQTFFEPTSAPKSIRIVPALKKIISATKLSSEHQLSFISPNMLEVQMIYSSARESGLMDGDEWWASIERLGLDSEWRNAVERWGKKNDIGWATQKGLPQMLVHLSPFFGGQIVKCGDKGVITLVVEDIDKAANSRTPGPTQVSHISDITGKQVTLSFHPAELLEAGEVINTTGAGDSLVGAIIAALVSKHGQDGWGWNKTVELGQKAARESLKSKSAVGPNVSKLIS